MKVLLAILAALPLFAQDTLSVTATAAQRGQVSDITIRKTTQSGTPASSVLQFKVDWPTGVFSSTTTEIGAAALSAQKVIACQANLCVIHGPNQSTIPDGIVAIFHATVAANAPNNFNLTNSGAVDGTKDGLPITVTINPTASVSVLSSKCDINGDGQINLTDRDVILSQVLGQVAATSDLNGDSQVNVLDLALVIKGVVTGACPL